MTGRRGCTSTGRSRTARSSSGWSVAWGTEDYENRTIRRHELTRYDKEEDRTRHIDVVGANTGLVFLLYRDPGGEIFSHVRSLIDGVQPDGSTTTASGVLHEVYRIADEAALARLESLFAGGCRRPTSRTGTTAPNRR